MNLHSSFTFTHFAALLIILLTAVYFLRRTEKANNTKKILYIQILISLALLFAGMMYSEEGFSSEYIYKSWGFPREVFRMYSINPAVENRQTFRVFSELKWGNLLQNLLLMYFFVNVLAAVYQKLTLKNQRKKL